MQRNIITAAVAALSLTAGIAVPTAIAHDAEEQARLEHARLDAAIAAASAKNEQLVFESLAPDVRERTGRLVADTQTASIQPDESLTGRAVVLQVRAALATTSNELWSVDAEAAALEPAVAEYVALDKYASEVAKVDAKAAKAVKRAKKVNVSTKALAAARPNWDGVPTAAEVRAFETARFEKLRAEITATNAAAKKAEERAAAAKQAAPAVAAVAGHVRVHVSYSGLTQADLDKRRGSGAMRWTWSGPAMVIAHSDTSAGRAFNSLVKGSRITLTGAYPATYRVVGFAWGKAGESMRESYVSGADVTLQVCSGGRIKFIKLVRA